MMDTGREPVTQARDLLSANPFAAQNLLQV